MNSYPLEPLMFVAGLAEARRESTGGSTAASRNVSTSSATTAEAGPGPNGEAPASAVSPSKDTTALPFTSPVADTVRLPPLLVGGTAAAARDSEFENLKADLRGVFAQSGGPTRVWVPDTDRARFRVVLVDKGVRMPLRKMHPERAGEETHSPLSPLTPSSPLYPDGLIAPVWIRKHAELVPSVFLLFLRLYETPPREAGLSPLGDEVLASAEREREKEADEALIKEISDRRMRLQDRGIKLTVVLMASSATLDAPGLDQRLSNVRRASQLSAKASLFVLTPVPAAELPEFVKSLHVALYDSAMDFYNQHSKRVRRKRGKASAAASVKENAGRNRAASVTSLQPKPLGPQGWTVRYDFKAGWFAEIRGDLDLARRHYEDCWNELAKMFSSTTVLPPRTKRWAEGKVLADCVALRICKLLLYEKASERVLVPYYVHLRRFGELSRGWGIGEETFEFWSWVARQYRLLGEILDLAIQNGFPVPALPAPTYPAPPPVPTVDALIPNSATNNMHLLHPPAFYYYAAACCTIERKARLEAALEAESRGGTALTAAPGFANEKKVDHAALTVELLTTAYNLLKESGQADSGLALYIAFRTAQVYTQAGQHELALRYLDRLADKFTAEKWDVVVGQLRELEYECSQATGNVETAVRLLFEMLSPNGHDKSTERATLQDEVLNLVKTTVPKSTESLVFELGSKAFLDLRTGFRAAEVAAGTPVRFQVSICAPPKVDVSKIEFTSLRIGFSDDLPDLVVTNGGLERVVDVGTVTAQSAPQVTAPLTFKTGEPLVLTGDLVGAVGEVSVSDVVLCLQHESWSIELRLLPRPLYMWTAGGTTYAPLSGLFPNVAFTPRPHDVRLDVQSAQIAFVGEKSPITVRVTSTDERPLGLTLSAALQDAEGGQLSHGSDSGAELRDIPVKLVDGAAEVTLSLTSSEPGSVVVELALTSTAHKDTSEIAHTVVVPVLAPFECAPTISRSGTHATVSAVIRVPARKITVTALEIDSHAEGVTLVSSSLSAVRLPLEWDASTSFALAARFRLQTLTQRAAAPPGAAAVIRVKWRPDGASDTDDEITTLLPLPPLASARPEAFVTATLATPTVVNAHTPFPLTLTVANAHPTDAAFVTVSGETAEGFVWTGPRGARVGPVPAGGTASVAFEAVPVGIAGWQALPHLGVWHGEGQDRREVRINVTQDRVVGTVLVQP